MVQLVVLVETTVLVEVFKECNIAAHTISRLKWLTRNCDYFYLAKAASWKERRRTMSRLIICIITLLVASAMEAATNVKRCGKDQPFPLSVNIEGCVEPPCEIIKGRTAIMEVHFVSTKNDINKLTAKVYATALGVSVPYELPEDVADVCSNLMYDANCPLYKTEDVVYQFNFYIDPYYPEIIAKIELTLVDEDNESIVCFICTIRVRKGPTSPN